MAFLDPARLTGDLVALEPLEPQHHDALVAAASDGRLWEHWYTAVPSPDGMAADIDRRLAMQAAGTMLPFVVRRLSDGSLRDTVVFSILDTEWPAVRTGLRYRLDRAGC